MSGPFFAIDITDLVKRIKRLDHLYLSWMKAQRRWFRARSASERRSARQSERYYRRRYDALVADKSWEQQITREAQ